jgi:hypothetical protein
MTFVSELQRRNVFRVAAAYLVVGWLLTEVLTAILPTLGAPRMDSECSDLDLRARFYTDADPVMGLRSDARGACAPSIARRRGT